MCDKQKSCGYDKMGSHTLFCDRECWAIHAMSARGTMPLLLLPHAGVCVPAGKASVSVSVSVSVRCEGERE